MRLALVLIIADHHFNRAKGGVAGTAHKRSRRCCTKWLAELHGGLSLSGRKVSTESNHRPCIVNASQADSSYCVWLQSLRQVLWYFLFGKTEVEMLASVEERRPTIKMSTSIRV